MHIVIESVVSTDDPTDITHEVIKICDTIDEAEGIYNKYINKDINNRYDDIEELSSTTNNSSFKNEDFYINIQIYDYFPI